MDAFSNTLYEFVITQAHCGITVVLKEGIRKKTMMVRNDCRF